MSYPHCTMGLEDGNAAVGTPLTVTKEHGFVKIVFSKNTVTTKHSVGENLIHDTGSGVSLKIENNLFFS